MSSLLVDDQAPAMQGSVELKNLEDNWARWLAARQAHPADPNAPMGPNENFLRCLDHFRRGIEQAAQKAPHSEVIDWRRSSDELPDAELTVLGWVPAVDEHDVDILTFCFWDGSQWVSAPDGWPIGNGVTCWAPEPRGPGAGA
jgi:hypothetical protein